MVVSIHNHLHLQGRGQLRVRWPPDPVLGQAGGCKQPVMGMGWEGSGGAARGLRDPRQGGRWVPVGAGREEAQAGRCGGTQVGRVGLGEARQEARGYLMVMA